MPIAKAKTPLVPRNKTMAGSTHGGNGGNVDIIEADQDLENNMSADTLIDPEDYTGGSTHSSVTAKAKKTRATVGDDCQQNIGTLPNDGEPAKGYLENASDFDMDDDEDMDEEEVQSSLEPDLENSNKPTPLTAEGDDEDWDAPLSQHAEDDIDEGEESISEDEGEEVVEPEEAAMGDEAMSLMDVDQVPDDDTNVAFATLGKRVMVIRSNRIIATLTERAATALGRADVYLTDQFQEVTAAEIAKQGLRKGLRSMGFIEAKVAMNKSSAVEARVKKLVHKQTAAVRKVNEVNAATMDQSMAIAAVGINRKYFAGVTNPLQDALEARLVEAGVRNPRRLLASVFASEGPAYAKELIQLATKLSAMPKETRAGFVEALDMTSGDMEESEEDSLPVGTDDPDELGEDDDVMPTTMATAGVARQRQIGNSVRPGMLSVTASAKLDGSQPLFLGR